MLGRRSRCWAARPVGLAKRSVSLYVVQRRVIPELIAEARASGARLGPCCEVLELGVRTVQRWLLQGPDGGDDRRHGPNTAPANKLSDDERRQIIEIATSPEYVDLPPHQVVPRLADMGIYIASESSIYRELRRRKLDPHRGRARPPTRRRPEQYDRGRSEPDWCGGTSVLHPGSHPCRRTSARMSAPKRSSFAGPIPGIFASAARVVGRSRSIATMTLRAKTM